MAAKKKTWHTWKSTDNSDLEGKKLLRDWALKSLGGATNCKVLELCGGEGHIFDACYTKVKGHMAFDIKPSNRPTWLRGDNRMLLQTRAKGWDLYDLDVYANPWILAKDIMRLRDPGKFAVVVTCGIDRSLALGNVSGFIKKAIGINGLAFNVGLLIRWREDIVRWLVAGWVENGVKVLEAKKYKSAFSKECMYYGFILEKAK